jgi:hypothetical protein
MRIGSIAVVLAFVGAITPAAAMRLPIITIYVTSGDLAQACKSSVSKDQNMCWNYVRGVMDTMREAARFRGEKSEPSPVSACMPTEPTFTEFDVIKVFLDWSDRNPDKLRTTSKFDGLVQAIRESWPCQRSE